MLTLHFADRYQAVDGPCPMSSAIQYNFISQLEGTDISFAPHEGPLGIKCCFNGLENYEVGRERFAVDRSSYLVLNDGQRYASSIRSHKRVESFCVWFRPGFAEQVLNSLRSPANRLLDEPGFASNQPLQFFEQLYHHDDLVSPILFRIHHAANKGFAEPPWLEEQFHLLMERLLQAHRNIYRDIERLPAVRKSTRIELYRRLCMAKNHLDSNLETAVTLQEMASVACLSPHHFLRQFKLLFGETPHQYHRRIRLEQAQRLLAETELPVTQICFDLGFESLSSFSWLFRICYGLSPMQYRAEHGRNQRVRLLSAEPDLAVDNLVRNGHSGTSKLVFPTG